MSFVARLTVTTMQAGAPCALRATYTDGVLDEAPKPCAGVPGTCVAVEDLFFNVATRRKALKGAAEEYGRVLDCVQRYACLRTDVSFSVRKQGEARADLHAPAAASRVDRVRTVFGAALARELLPFTASAVAASDAAPSFTLDGLASGPAYGSKRATFIFFINGRLVECGPLRRALEAVYAAVLPKADRPWLFLAMQLPPAHVDVNTHPTKAEVAFLHAEELVAAAAAALQAVLQAANGARTYEPGAATGASVPSQLPPSQKPQVRSAPQASTQRERAGGDHKLVRTDARAERLDAFVLRPSDGGPPQLLLGRGRGREEAQPAGEDAAPRSLRPRVSSDEAGFAAAAPCELTSVSELRAALDAAAHPGLLELLRRYTYVGLATPALALLQHGTKLYLASLPRLTRELFAQLPLLSFGAVPPLLLTPPAPVEELLLEACAAAATRGGSPPAETARAAGELLLAKAPMLREYFALDIGEAGGTVELRALPALCAGYAPSLLGLPEFLLHLASDTDWTAEQACFADIARHLGALYALRPPPPGATALQDHERSVAHVLLPALRSHLRPPAPFATDGTVLQVACLEQLYKVFERC